MKLPLFKLEKFFSIHEFTAPHLLCCSDAESMNLQELLDLATPQEKELWNTLSLSYTETYGHPLLRQEIAQQFYPTLTDKNILCFTGAQEGIFAALYTICQPQDHVIVLTPCYESLLQVPAWQQADITQIELQEKNEWRININDIAQAIQPNTTCIVMNFPHNPTGQIIRQNELYELIKLCKKHSLWLFSDEVYYLSGILPEASWPMPAAQAYEKAISLGVMSKAFGLPGLRIGWIACQNTNILEKINETKNYLSICNSAPSEILSIIALRHKDQILAKNNAIIEKNLKLLDSFFATHQHLFSWIRPQGGCTGFVHYKGPGSVEEFCKKLIEQEGILLLPASVYNYPHNYFRIGFGKENMPEMLKKFEKNLQANNL